MHFANFLVFSTEKDFIKEVVFEYRTSPCGVEAQ